MSLMSELRDHVSAYLAGREGFSVLYDWLGSNAIPILESGDAALLALDNRIWVLISRAEDERMDEASFRQTLQDVLHRWGSEFLVREQRRPFPEIYHARWGQIDLRDDATGFNRPMLLTVQQSPPSPFLVFSDPYSERADQTRSVAVLV